MLASCLLLLVGYASCQTLVNTPLGQVQGIEYTTKSGRVADVFLGIPYATPTKRYERPQDPTPWRGVLNATQFGNVCPPHTRQAVQKWPTSENCLLLNIIRPRGLNSTANLPVLVWVHGGGFMIGSAQMFGYKGFADNYVPRDIIVVTYQYRLGPHGFLYSPKYGIKGNFGYWDMAKAFQFIKKNIASFGGNPNKLTVWGLSAGGSASNALIISPVTRDMISASIEMSGSAHSTWGTGPNVHIYSDQLIEQLRCGNTNKTAVLTCLQNKTLDDMYNAVADVGYTTNGLDSIKWGPVIDGEFMTKTPDALSREAPPKPTMIGVSDKDAAYFCIMNFSPYIQNLSIAPADQPGFNNGKFMERISPLLKPNYFGNNTNMALRIIENTYAQPGRTNGYYLDSYTKFMNAMFFDAPVLDSIRYRSQAGWSMYAYRFDQYNPIIWTSRNWTIPREVWGSVHVNEYSYMFDMFVMGQFNMTGADAESHESLVTSIASMAKYGRPSVPSVNWTTTGNQLNFLVFQGRGHMEQNYLAPSSNFTQQIRRLGFDLSSLSRTRPATA